RDTGGSDGQVRRLRQRIRARLHRADRARRRRVRLLRMRHPRPRPTMRPLRLHRDRPRRGPRRAGVLLPALRGPGGAGGMSRRSIHCAPDLARAEQAVAIARTTGLGDEALSLIARSDIEVGAVSDDLKQADTDRPPAAARAPGAGAARGAVPGRAAAASPPLGRALAGARVAGGGDGAPAGGWASAVCGATLPEPERRNYEALIEAGKVLVVVAA